MKFTESFIINLIQEQYGLDVSCKILNGYDELNFLLTDSFDKKYIFKIATEEHNPYFLDAQVQMVKLLAKSPMAEKFQHYLTNESQQEIGQITIEGFSYYYRLLSFLEGDFWVNQKHKSPALALNLGRFLGEMDALLKDFKHPAANRYYEWDVKNALDARKNLACIQSHENRRLVAYFLLQFETEVSPNISSLRTATIHNDANDYNVLVNGDSVSGLIDFGDMVHTSLINNLAIACTYAMLDTENPLEVAAEIVKGYHQKMPLTAQELSLLYYLIAGRLCISLCQSAYNYSKDSTNEHHFITEKPAWKLLHQLIRINPLKAHNEFRLACGFSPVIHPEDNHETILKERQQYIGKNLSISYAKKVKIDKGALQYLYDDQGNTFLDCVNNVSHVGHCHPTVVKAMQKQIATLNTNTRYLNTNIIDYAKKLTATLPKELTVCYFTNSGSEANDLAIRMSRHFTKQKDVIVLDHAYHGTSTTAIEMSPYKFDGKGGFGKMSYIHKAQNPDMYRGEYKYGDSKAGEKYAKDVDRIITALETESKKPAAFICETLLGVGGQIALPPNYLKEVYAKVREAGGICIADEVQVGFGRVGTKFWGFELQDVVPDIVVLGKPMGNGHPLAAVVTTQEIADAFNNGMEYFNTFGGNPVSMATGLAVLNVIEEEELQQNALEVGNYLVQRLAELKPKYDIIGDVRGNGLFVGVELVRDRITLEPAVPEIDHIVEKMKDRGFFISTDGPLYNVLKIKPPIIFSKENADEFVDNLDAVFGGF
ncbi:aminotransferase class III-fold pyridoxal phosphate-dependent enzyme [Flavobacterium granuli]|uniref:Hydroxylysine kinase /5-phosphonooxy-L-lysine phospho-lyase n=1 Tax=Flavobacterium granuli TaxID=280093 RepID=A0A1M5TG82_9FLAO|nr:aminotransferase class III-fold pyridoxal phosphate-dependent enzyme [Flavobacterium granuli]PRZ20364.1 hydroxylysine kinase /5-phosphonooxy-L-lysine phospho-lyase [Flavobacterium granuli]SHH49767.1 hydroxylysine kinase /5-phosphonooxy-L-lysine phospho-lyase apoenzyme [Flavobacterium granuli]